MASAQKPIGSRLMAGNRAAGLANRTKAPGTWASRGRNANRGGKNASKELPKLTACDLVVHH